MADGKKPIVMPITDKGSSDKRSLSVGVVSSADAMLVGKIGGVNGNGGGEL